MKVAPSIVICLLTILHVVCTLRAETSSTFDTTPLLFLDDFADGNDSGWVLATGDVGVWQVVDGIYEGVVLGVQRSSRMATGSSLWRNYELRAEIRGVAGNDKGLYFRYLDEHNFCSINIRPFNGDVVLTGVRNGLKQIDTYYAFPTQNQQWNHVVLKVYDSDYTCDINGNRVFTYVDTLTGLDRGKIAIEVYSADLSESHTQFDNISVSCLELVPCSFAGDPDGSGAVSIADAVYLINYIFGGGPAPNPLESGDAECSGLVSIADAVYLINYIFAGGPPPCEP